jgi:hypothetical protein
LGNLVIRIENDKIFHTIIKVLTGLSKRNMATCRAKRHINNKELENREWSK